MGWLSWERFRCNTDCDNDPEFCIGENLFKQMADMMVLGGYREAGYDTIIIDDCWLDRKRSNMIIRLAGAEAETITDFVQIS